MVGSLGKRLPPSVAVAHLKNPRIALRKLFAACGAAARRSRPALMVSLVMLIRNSSPAVLTTARKMFSR